MNKPNLKIAMDTRLSGLRVTPGMRERIVSQWRGEKVMKRKMALGLTLAIVLLLLTVGAAIALTSSDLLSFMFGQEQPPKEVEEIVSKPEATTATPDIKLTLNEYLYDGEKLYLYWTLTNQAGRQLMVTMDPIKINGRKVNVEQDKPFQSEFGVFGKILGGEAEGIVLPESISFVNVYINPDKYMPGYYAFKSGEKLEITSNLSVWELLSPPELVYDSDHQIKKEFLDEPSLQGMPTFQNGTCGLGWLLYLDYSMEVYNAEKNLRTYEKNNWAKMLYQLPVQVSITLDSISLKKTRPLEMSFSTKNFSMQIIRMAYMSTGGTLVLHVVPKPQSTIAKTFLDLGNDFVVLDADSKEVVSGYTVFTEVSELESGVKYTIALKAVSDSMPKAILIVPAAVNTAWNKDSANIYPDATSPGKDSSYYTFLMEDAVMVELE